MLPAHLQASPATRGHSQVLERLPVPYLPGPSLCLRPTGCSVRSGTTAVDLQAQARPADAPEFMGMGVTPGQMARLSTACDLECGGAPTGGMRARPAIGPIGLVITYSGRAAAWLARAPRLALPQGPGMAMTRCRTRP